MAEEHRQDRILRVWDIIEKTPICMLTTGCETGLRARPLQPRIDRAAGVLWFVTDAHSGKAAEIEHDHDVGLVFINDADKAYLSLTARARLLADHHKAAEIWQKTDDMWWNGPDDPAVRVLRVVPVIAELWDGPSNAVVEIFEIGKALLTGAPPELGENRKITVALG